MAKKHININDLKDNAKDSLSEDDLQKVTGGISFVGGWGSSSYQYAFEGTYSSLANKSNVNLSNSFLKL